MGIDCRLIQSALIVVGSNRYFLFSLYFLLFFYEDRYYAGSVTSAPTVSLLIGWDMAGHTRNWPISKHSSELAVTGCQPRAAATL